MSDVFSSDRVLIEEKVSPLITPVEKATDSSCNITDIITQAKVKIVENNTDMEIDLIRPIIRDSWLRCYHQGLNLFDYNIGPILDKPVFDKILQNKTHLIDAAVPYIRKLAAMCSNSMIMLTDEKGVVLYVQMDKNRHFSWTVDRFHLVPGIIWAEETVGTLTTTLCEKYQIPIQMSGPEHYSETYFVYTASSAPVMDINNNLTGTITLVTQDYITQNPHTLALIISISENIEKELHRRSNQDFLGGFLDASDQGVLILNNSGKITHANPKVCKILNFEMSKITGLAINDVIDNQPFINSLLETGTPVYDIKVNSKGQNLSTYLSLAKKLGDNYGNTLGYTLIFKEAEESGKKHDPSPGQETKINFDHIIGKSPQIVNAINLAKKYAAFDDNILIYGESGTGKELFAQAIHNACCPDGPFIAINCAAIPKNLIESELFGYEAGAFTGADRQGRKGKIELAEGGTLFLDEIGDMPLELQPALLRVLEEKQIMRVGGIKYKPVKFRLIVATNQVLPELIEKKTFREDLYYRLEVLQIHVPPLRERGQDIIELANHILRTLAAKQGKLPLSLNEAAIYKLMQFDWPGNVRQLKNAMIYVCDTANHPVIGPEDLPSQIDKSRYVANQARAAVPAVYDGQNSIKDMQKTMIIQAIVQTNKNIAETARVLGLSKSTLYKKIKEYGILNQIRSS